MGRGNGRKIFNEDLEEQYQKTAAMSDEELNEVLDRHKDSKRAFAALVLLLEASKKDSSEEVYWLDGWECHMEEIVWPDILGEQNEAID